jgi:hypothetical protein
MLARYFLQRLCKDTKNSGEFEYPTDNLVEEMTTSLNAVVVRYEVLTAVCLKVKFVGMLALLTGTYVQTF